MRSNPRVAIVIDLEWPVAYHLQTFAGIYRYATEHGHWNSSIAPYLDAASIQESSFDGVIGRITPRLAGAVRKLGVPVVNVWLNSPAKGVFSVLPDVTEAGRMSVQHLLARGFRKFAYVGYEQDRFSYLQLTGIREQLASADCRLWEHWTARLRPEDKQRWQRFQRELDGWFDKWTPPVAVIATNDQLARYLIEAAQRRGLQVPTDVAFIGSVNEVAICTMLEPSLTSIDYGFERIGYAAAKALDLWMQQKSPRSGAVYLPPRQLIIRQSSGAFAVDQPAVVAVLSYISENLHKALTLERLAKRVATTPRTLSRLFQKSLGKTVHEMVTQLRIERVKRELVESDDLLKIIARRCGFRDAVYMCKVFQGLEKITPSQYRASR